MGASVSRLGRASPVAPTGATAMIIAPCCIARAIARPVWVGSVAFAALAMWAGLAVAALEVDVKLDGPDYTLRFRIRPL
jgi:hypothetical protein